MREDGVPDYGVGGGGVGEVGGGGGAAFGGGGSGGGVGGVGGSVEVRGRVGGGYVEEYLFCVPGEEGGEVCSG